MKFRWWGLVLIAGGAWMLLVTAAGLPDLLRYLCFAGYLTVVSNLHLPPQVQQRIKLRSIPWRIAVTFAILLATGVALSVLAEVVLFVAGVRKVYSASVIGMLAGAAVMLARLDERIPHLEPDVNERYPLGWR